MRVLLARFGACDPGGCGAGEGIAERGATVGVGQWDDEGANEPRASLERPKCHAIGWRECRSVTRSGLPTAPAWERPL